MVAAADLSGFLVHPQTTPAAGVLVLVDAIDEASRTQAHQLATAGEVVMLIEPSVSTARGSDYLNRLSITRGVRTLCLRQEC